MALAVRLKADRRRWAVKLLDSFPSGLTAAGCWGVAHSAVATLGRAGLSPLLILCLKHVP